MSCDKQKKISYGIFRNVMYKPTVDPSSRGTKKICQYCIRHKDDVRNRLFPFCKFHNGGLDKIVCTGMSLLDLMSNAIHQAGVVDDGGRITWGSVLRRFRTI